MRQFLLYQQGRKAGFCAADTVQNQQKAAARGVNSGLFSATRGKMSFASTLAYAPSSQVASSQAAPAPTARGLRGGVCCLAAAVADVCLCAWTALSARNGLFFDEICRFQCG
jgi:hypothetical protein